MFCRGYVLSPYTFQKFAEKKGEFLFAISNQTHLTNKTGCSMKQMKTIQITLQASYNLSSRSIKGKTENH